MAKGVAGADNSRRATRLRRQSLNTTTCPAASAGFSTASMCKTGEYIRPSAKVAHELRDKASADFHVSQNATKSTEISPLNGGKQGWNYARGTRYGSLNTMSEETATTRLLEVAFSSSSIAPSIFDSERGTFDKHAKATIYSWNKWMKIYVGFLLVVFMVFGVLMTMGKVAGGRKKGASSDKVKSSASIGTETRSFWNTLDVAMAAGSVDLIFAGGLGEV